MSNTAYLRRALGLASADGHLLVGAFLLLFAYTATNLALPDYQVPAPVRSAQTGYLLCA